MTTSQNIDLDVLYSLKYQVSNRPMNVGIFSQASLCGHFVWAQL